MKFVPDPKSKPAFDFTWLTPARCRATFIAIQFLVLIAHIIYLHHSPLDLSGDEAQYWDWSRYWQWSYYSKGPLVAWIIRASCAIFGDTMPAVRYPALLLGIGTSACIYWLTNRLFKSEKLALGASLIPLIMPLFIAGSLLMTIDAPFVFCWALACCVAHCSLSLRERDGVRVDGRRNVRSPWNVFRFVGPHPNPIPEGEGIRAWILLGIVIGIGFLAKYAMLLFLPALILFCLLDPKSRPQLKSPGIWLATLTALLFTIPVLIWNAQHDWVGLRHVGTQTGAMGENRAGVGTLLEFLASQIALVNPAIAVFLLAAIVVTIRNRFWESLERPAEYRAKLFLLTIGGFFFLVTASSGLRAKPQANWAAPSYVTLAIVAAHFISTKLRSPEQFKPWRAFAMGAIVIGAIAIVLLHQSAVLYPLAKLFKFPAAKIDFAYKLRGNEELAQHVQSLLTDKTFVACEDYQNTALMAFYLKNHPRTFYAGSYWSDELIRRRLTQYDLWPDAQLDRPDLRGQDCIFIGTPAEPWHRSFTSWEKLGAKDIVRHGLLLRRVPIYRGKGFLGMTRPIGGQKH